MLYMASRRTLPPPCGIIHGAWEANLFVSNVFDKQAALSRFNSDNYDASTRSRIFTNRPRTAGLSLQWKF